MSFSGNRNITSAEEFDFSAYELGSHEGLPQNWAYNNMTSNLPSYPTEESYLSSFEDYSEIPEVPYTNEATFVGNLNENPYNNGFILSTPFNNEVYNLQQLPLPQQQQIYNSSSLSPSYYQSPSIPTRQPTPSKIPLPNSPTPSTASTLSLTSMPSPSASPSVSAWPSADLQAQKTPLSSSALSHRSTSPLLNSSSNMDRPIPYITTTLIPTEESRRRNRRREQNRKAQFIFRQKRKDEVQRLQLEINQLKGLLASRAPATTSTATSCGTGELGTCRAPCAVPMANNGFSAQCY